MGIAVAILWGVPHPAAQELSVRPLPELNMAPSAGDPVLTPSAMYDPSRVRTLLMHIHGFTQAQLDAVSTDIPQILTALIDDPDEPMLIRRQAIKALRLYPSEETFRFIADRLGSSSVALQVLYLGSLAAFRETSGEELMPILESMLDHQDVVVRHTAVGLAGRLRLALNTESLLVDRLSVEPDSGVRQAIQKQLSTTP